MHQRIRERLPHLPVLVDTAEKHRDDQAALLAAARQMPSGETFEHAGRTYRRTRYRWDTRSATQHGPDAVLVTDEGSGERIELLRKDEDAFWAWAIIETLRHTGVRVEELLELTHLALVSYRLPDSGEVVPRLQIVPSKSNEERLLLVTPDLASVLATVVCRIRGDDGRVPLAARYDVHERVTGPMLPHLFQRKIGWRREIISTRVANRLLNDTLKRSGLTDRAGQPLRYTPHDFRRMFITDAVTGGLPVHIAAKILGHHSLNTTQAYLAVFQEELIKSYRAFLDTRRTARPAAEYREPTEPEWDEFQKHFELRKVELGTCGRPYGTPAHTNTPASGVRCSASARSSADVWKRSSATSVTASRRPAATAGSARSKGSRSASPPAKNSPPSIGSPEPATESQSHWACRSSQDSRDDAQIVVGWHRVEAGRRSTQVYSTSAQPPTQKSVRRRSRIEPMGRTASVAPRRLITTVSTCVDWTRRRAEKSSKEFLIARGRQDAPLIRA